MNAATLSARSPTPTVDDSPLSDTHLHSPFPASRLCAQIHHLCPNTRFILYIRPTKIKCSLRTHYDGIPS